MVSDLTVEHYLYGYAISREAATHYTHIRTHVAQQRRL